MNWSTTGANWSNQSASKVSVLLQCSSCSSPLRDGALEWSTGPVPCDGTQTGQAVRQNPQRESTLPIIGQPEKARIRYFERAAIE
ncbi:hypothetical protein SAMN05414138_10217 [Rhodoplanes sp. JGI PP 4-B12]|nr:hypothetical protein SAMN05414138_10217 [Rhodoplanes sp. JGI PP 4-B12]